MFRNQKTYPSLVIFWLYCFFFLRVGHTQDSIDRPLLDAVGTAKVIRYQNPDSSVILLQEAYNESISVGDTLQAINALLEMTDVYGHQANYAKSYDYFWDVLFLSDNIKNDSLRAIIYYRLGRMYSFYKRREDAFKYLQTSLDINKNLVSKGKMDKAYLVQNYYAFCNTYRELDEPKTAKIYLDSCFAYYKNVPGQVNMASLKFEKAFILGQEGKTSEALQIMKEVEPWFLENLPSYLVLVYTYWGDMFRSVSNFQESESYYNKALEISDTYNSHIDFTPLVYERLSDLYLKTGDYQNAFENQRVAKNLDAQFFDSRSERNKPLLEIKDEFRREKERQEKLIQQQRLEQLEQEDKISLLQRIILLGSLIFLIIIGLIYVKHLRSKHKAEKQLIRRNKELEIQKAEELLELKNKELATSALQLVEKDEFLQMLKDKLKKNGESVKASELNQVLKSISVSNTNNWEEFKLRFTAVNEKFYKELIQRYPKLTQSDQKICALIKLNFSSKDMARLLGISVESVHTTRYRLRKKMGLDRSINLEEYIASM
ncbi:tetratricopeptide repeat protein [Ulvibacterium marinum]|uniref:tetratricopeptide repeat protein n=1 Tax=Ulvibacterium marinum TaxID=2419782 RepID=UPI00249471D5|nr:hypothetical protein [Ulvibacterium marinum]